MGKKYLGSAKECKSRHVTNFSDHKTIDFFTYKMSLCQGISIVNDIQAQGI